MSRAQPTSDDRDTREVAVPVATLWRSPDAPRDIDEPAVRDLPDIAAWAEAMDQEARLGLHGRTETQLLLGEPVLVTAWRDGWAKVVAPRQSSALDGRGYPGWVRSAHLGTPGREKSDDTATVVTRSAPCTVDGVELELSFGTTLPVADLAKETATVVLAGDRRGQVPLGALRVDRPLVQPVYRPDAVLDAARQFLGLRYLWGGTSGWGVDCSGLVHLTMRSFAVVLPRDAHDQAAATSVDEVPLDAVRPGDLYFFARPGERVYHVGFVTRPTAPDGTRWMLHAPEGGELVEDAPLAPHRVESLVSAGRVRTPPGPGFAVSAAG